MFDLNDNNEFNGGNTIFNGGVAGLVKNVKIDSVEEKKQGDNENAPDYKLFVADAAGNKINEGFYIPTKNTQKSEEDNIKYARMQINRVLHIAKAVMGNEYEFPKVNSPKEAFEVLFKLIKENTGDKKFNVYTTYGTVSYPSKYLKLRYFDFIESADKEGITLLPKNTDNLKRIEADDTSDNSSNTDTEESWI